jgi:hypothetical protein
MLLGKGKSFIKNSREDSVIVKHKENQVFMITRITYVFYMCKFWNHNIVKWDGAFFEFHSVGFMKSDA